VAVLKPVNVGGVTISKSTLHNEDEVNRLGLGGFTANSLSSTPWRVRVARAGDVIPKVIGVIEKPHVAPYHT
jgi:DNA ligase (NAD+)